VKKGQILVELDARDNQGRSDQARRTGSRQRGATECGRRRQPAMKDWKTATMHQKQYDDLNSINLSRTSSHIDGSGSRAPNFGSVTRSCRTYGRSDGKKAVEAGMSSRREALSAFVEGHTRGVTTQVRRDRNRRVTPGKKSEVDVDSIPGEVKVR